MMTWKRFDVTKYTAAKTKAEMANENRRMAQRLIKAQLKRTVPPMVKLNRHGKHK